MTTKEILIKARELISNPKCWKTGSLGSSLEGSYCAVGAVLEATGEPWNAIETSRGALGGLAALIDPSEAEIDPHHGQMYLTGDEQMDNWKKVVNYNNTKGHECVLNLFDAAIERQP